MIPMVPKKTEVFIWSWRPEGYVKFYGELEVNTVNGNSKLTTLGKCEEKKENRISK